MGNKSLYELGKLAKIGDEIAMIKILEQKKKIIYICNFFCFYKYITIR